MCCVYTQAKTIWQDYWTYAVNQLVYLRLPSAVLESLHGHWLKMLSCILHTSHLICAMFCIRQTFVGCFRSCFWDRQIQKLPLLGTCKGSDVSGITFPYSHFKEASKKEVGKRNSHSSKCALL